MNKRGQLIAERLAWANEINTSANEKFQGFAEVILEEPLADSIYRGRVILSVVRDGVHGDIDPQSVDPNQSGQWMKAMRDLEAIAGQLQAPPINNWLKDDPTAEGRVALEAKGGLPMGGG